MTDNLSNNIPTPFAPLGNPSVLPDSPPPSEVAVDPIPPLPTMSASAANPPSKFGDPEPKVETVIEPDPPKPVEKPVTPPVPSVPEENPAIRPPGAQSAIGDKSKDPYVKKHHGLPKVTIAGIASLVFLVVALGSGLYLTGKKQETRVGACWGSWDCGGNSYCAGASGQPGESGAHPGSCAEGGNRPRYNEEVQQDYLQGGGQTNDGKTASGGDPNVDLSRIQGQLRAEPTNPPPGQDASLPQPTDSPAGSSCNDCGGFNQGRCEGPGFTGCGAACDPGLSTIAGGCYPPSYHACQGKGVFPPETSCNADDPCAGVTCSSGQYCNAGACVTPKTTVGAGKAIVSFSCSSCSADRRCDSNPQVNSSGYGKACGQVDECPSANGVIDYSRCNAIKLCDSSCSGGFIPGTNGDGGPTSPPGSPTTPATISANCQSLVAQMSNGSGGWITKTDAEFAAQARPGNGVRFVCTGHKTQGAFTKAAFFINGTLHVDDVVKLNADQYAVEYTIPAAGSLEIESVLLHDTKGWVD